MLSLYIMIAIWFIIALSCGFCTYFSYQKALISKSGRWGLTFFFGFLTLCCLLELSTIRENIVNGNNKVEQGEKP